LPDFIEAYNKYGKDIAIIGINLNDEPQEVEQYRGENKIPFFLTIDNTGDMVYKYRLQARPYTIVVDKKGIITYIQAGLFKKEKMEQEIAKALAT
jgi:peroxiredoxin